MKKVARPLQISIHVGKVLRRLVPVTGAEVTIGRGPDNHVVSANGTCVNNQKVDRAAVQVGDEIRVGPFRLLLGEATDVAAPRWIV